MSYFSDQGAMAIQRPGTRLALHLIWKSREFWTLHRALILLCTHRQNSVWVDKSKPSYVIPCLHDVLTAPFISKSNNILLLCFPPPPPPPFKFAPAYSSQLALTGLSSEFLYTQGKAWLTKRISPVRLARYSSKLVSDRADQHINTWTLLTLWRDF